MDLKTYEKRVADLLAYLTEGVGEIAHTSRALVSAILSLGHARALKNARGLALKNARGLVQAFAEVLTQGQQLYSELQVESSELQLAERQAAWERQKQSVLRALTRHFRVLQVKAATTLEELDEYKTANPPHPDLVAALNQIQSMTAEAFLEQVILGSES